MNLAKMFLAIGIVVILSVFINYGLYLIYESPRGGKEARNQYSFNIFIILTIIGVVLIIMGMLTISLESIGSGIFGAGIITVVHGVIRSFGVVNKLISLIILFDVFILTVLLGSWKIERRKSRVKSEVRSE